MTIKFVKLDKYFKPVFLASFEENEEACNALSELHETLTTKYPEHRNPVYVSDRGYCCITLMNLNNYSFKQRNIYQITFNLKKKDKYINAFLSKSKLIKVGDLPDYGDDLEL